MRLGTTQILGLAGAFGVLVGCQGLPPASQGSALDNAGFMSLWQTYRHCEASTEVEAMRGDALRLAQAAREAVPVKPTVPSALKQYVSDPPHRLAVEPAAMAAACGLQAGHAALSAGRVGLADEMYRLVLSYPAGKFPYLASQARAGLDQITLQLQPQLAQAPGQGSDLSSAVASPLAD